MPTSAMPHRRKGVGPRVLLSVIVLAVLAAYAILWPSLAPANWADSDYLRARSGPSWPHVMGTDGLGFDVSVRVAEALQVSLTVAVVTAIAATLIGIAVGATAAAWGGRVDAVLMRLTDAAASVPHLLATIVVVAMFRGSLTAIIIALTLTHWTTLARIVRAETQAVMSTDFIAVTRAAGATRTHLVRHHILPAVAPQAGIAVVMMVPHAIWHESTLSFLGIGLAPEQASLGTLIHASRSGLLEGQWWALAAPAAVLIAVTVSIAALRPGTATPKTRPALPTALPTRSLATGEGLAVQSLTVRLPTAGGRWVHAVTEVTLRAQPGELVAVVGESGAGKSTLAATIAGLLPAGAATSGTVCAGRVGFVPQNPAAAFTPTRHLRGQLEEIARAHCSARSVAELCTLVGLPGGLIDRYPHQLSGGQIQRVAIAAALACDPHVLVADEPTSSLDPDLAADTLHLLRRLADTTGATVLLITHDLQSLADTAVADRVAVLYAGHLVDNGPALQLLDGVGHPYTAALAAALPAGGLHPLPGMPPTLTDLDHKQSPWQERGLDAPWPPEPALRQPVEAYTEAPLAVAP